MLKRKPCKFFAQGACLKGDLCNFSHDHKGPLKNATQICSFYQKGICSYGSQCRFQHVKSSWVESTAGASSSSSLPNHPLPSNAVTAEVGTGRLAMVRGIPVETSRTFGASSNGLSNLESRNVKPEHHPLYSFDAAGNCSDGDERSNAHADLCPTCEKYCLHPLQPEEREEHLKMCEKKQKHIDALKHSQEIECSICLDPVLSKATVAERKFAVFPECDHPFCISCIRKWRSTSRSSGMESMRSCPICRKPSHFVVPSLVWYSSKEEKQEIIDNYKARLRVIDCKHFNFGNGNCSFGANCFYKHTVKRGSYMWKYNRPPPRRAPPRRSNAMDFDSSYDYEDDDYLNFLAFAFEDFTEEGELDMYDMYDVEDYFDDDDELSPCDIDIALLFAQVRMESMGF